MRYFLQESYDGIYFGFSFLPCSAAVRAQHMELEPSWLLKPQNFKWFALLDAFRVLLDTLGRSWVALGALLGRSWDALGRLLGAT